MTIKEKENKMAMTIRHHALFWVCATAVFFGFVWLLGDALLPFICGMTIAYLLGPIVRRMIHRGVPRKYAALLILGTFFLLTLILLALIVPFAWRQAAQLAAALPQFADRLQAEFNPYIQWVQQRFDTGDLTEYQTALKDNLGKVFQVSGTLLAGIIGGGRVALGIVSFLFITPIVAFFMMEQWVAITRWIDDMIPRKNYEKIRELLSQMDEKVSGFIRGQLIISFLLGISYAVVLTLAGLKFGFLIGLMTGILSIIPLVGTTIGLITSVSVAWFQSYSLSYTGIIATIFVTGQFLEGNIITPKIMGNSVGLHPVWILFALLAGGALFGLTGMFLAVPVAAVIGVLCAFAVKEYKRSLYYDNHPEPEAPPVQVIVQVPPVPPEKPAIIHPDDPEA
jgi:predicted PurR-regulated permease PerM